MIVHTSPLSHSPPLLPPSEETNALSISERSSCRAPARLSSFKTFGADRRRIQGERDSSVLGTSGCLPREVDGTPMPADLRNTLPVVARYYSPCLARSAALVRGSCCLRRGRKVQFEKFVVFVLLCCVCVCCWLCCWLCCVVLSVREVETCFRKKAGKSPTTGTICLSW